MQARKKPSRISDHDAPKTEGKGKNSRKGHSPREGEEAKASSSPVQRPIDRTDGGSKVVSRVGGEPMTTLPPNRRTREDDPANPTEGHIVTPIQRPDPNSEPIVRKKPGSERGGGQ
jgi:hypothetical protein